MSSKFFGNRTDKHQPKKKGVKQNYSNKNNKSKSSVSEKLAGEANILNLVLKSEKA